MLTLDGSLPERQDGAALCVLASGSAGNCSVLAIRRGSITRICLIDLGLSPRRTFRLLAERGLSPHQIDDCFLTHLDADHVHPGWASAMPRHATVRVHRRHAPHLHGPFRSAWRIAEFDGPFALDEHAHARPRLMDHDELGVSVLRFDLRGLGAGVLGFATDVGRVTPGLLEHLSDDGGLDVLAIESNYCPEMQAASARPEFLKRRITGGRGHLSNQEAAEAVRAVEPRDHVVLLHLSRECNTPERVSDLHAGAEYGYTISTQDRPTRWIRVAPHAGNGRPPRAAARCMQDAPLFAQAAGLAGATA